MFAVFAALIIPSALAPAAGTYAGCLLFASLMQVPISGLGSAEVEARIGKAQRAEAFSSFLAATMIGGGLGCVLNGVLVLPLGAWNIPYLTFGLFAAVAAILAASARRLDRLNSDSAPPPEPGPKVPAPCESTEHR
jgi:MFS family permease